MKATRQGTTTGKDTANNDQWEPFCTTTDDKCGLSVGQTHRTGGLEADCLYCNCAIKQCIYKLVRLCHKEQTIATSNRCNHHGRNRRSRVLSHSTINNTTDNVDNNRHRTNCNKQKTIDTDSCQWSVHEGRSQRDQRQPHDVRRPPSIVHRPPSAASATHTHTHTHTHTPIDHNKETRPDTKNTPGPDCLRSFQRQLGSCSGSKNRETSLTGVEPISPFPSPPQIVGEGNRRFSLSLRRERETESLVATFSVSQRSTFVVRVRVTVGTLGCDGLV